MKPETKSSKLLPLAFVIFILAILFGASLLFARVDLNGSSDGVANIELDHSLVKVLLKEGGSSSQELRVMNVGSGIESISVSSNLGDLLSISDDSFELSSGQTKVLTLEFVSSINDVEYSPGVYSGYVLLEGAGYSVELPIILDIESEEVLFDSSLSFTKTEYEPGDSFSLPVRIYNLVSGDPTNVLFEYTIKDLAGNLVYSGAETVLVDGQASLSNSIDLSSNLNLGYYVLGVKVSYAGSVGVSSEVLEIVGEEEESVAGFTNFCGGSLIFCSLSVIIFIILLIFIGLFVFFFLRGRFKDQKEKVSKEKIEDSGLGGSMTLYLLIGLLIFFVLLLIVFVSGLVSYPSFIAVFSAIPLSIYILLFVLVVLFLGVMLYKDLQTVRTKSYYHQVERLKQSLEIEKYKSKLEFVRAKKEKTEEKGWFARWREERQRKQRERNKLEDELRSHKESLEKKKLLMRKQEEDAALRLKIKLEKKKLAEEDKALKLKLELEKQKLVEKEKNQKVFRNRIHSILYALPIYLEKRKERKEEENKQKLVEENRARKEKLKFDSALVHIKELQEKEEKNTEALQAKKVASELKNLEKQKVEAVVEKGEVSTDPEKIVVALPVRALPTFADHVINPWERCNKLLGFCYKALLNNDLNKVEMYYSEIKPLFLQLERWQKQNIYPKLVELQNEMTMLHMNSLRSGLENSKKKKK